MSQRHGLKLKPPVRVLKLVLLVAIFMFLSACDIVPLHMRDNARYEPFEQSTFFEDGLAMRPVVANTVARGDLRTDELLYEGRIDGELANVFPFEITEDILLQGQERYNIYCAPCHGRVGDGTGMIVQRGMRQPVSFHSERLRSESVGYYYDVITNGFGVMYSYASRIPVEDRWAIVAYVRALQRSQNADISDVPEIDLPQLDGN